MRPAALPILLFSCLVLPLGAQDALPPDAEPIPPEELEEELDDLFDRALKLEISARITTLDGEEVFWNMDLTRITLAGRAVQVRLDGSNITVLADFTPYVQDDGSLVLVAEGRTWLSGEDEAVSYRTSFKSLPIRLGEPVLFFPLGNRPVTAVGEEGGEQFNIELEINVVSYGEHG